MSCAGQRSMNEPQIRRSNLHPARLGPPAAKAGRALLHWLRATFIDAILVGALWLIGLWLLRIPLAPLWAVVAALVQFIPQYGGMLALIGPSLTLLFTSAGWEKFGLLLGLYAVIVIIDQLGLQPWIMKKNYPGADLGVHLWTDRTRDHHSILGSVAGATVIGGHFRIS